MKILGQEYTIKTNEDLARRGLDGETDLYGHEISVRPLAGMLEEGASYANKAARYEESLRHEIIHAFFFESGLPNYAYDETLVEWIADLFPKLQRAFKEAGCDSPTNMTVGEAWAEYWKQITKYSGGTDMYEMNESTSVHETGDTYSASDFEE